MSYFFRISVAAILALFVAHRGFYNRRVRHAAEEIVEQPHAGPTNRVASLLALPALLSAAVYGLRPAWLSWSAFSLPAWLRSLGLGSALAGFGLLHWSQQTLGQNWSDTPRLVEGQEVVSGGPYRWIRHPIYAAFLLILGSLLSISANWFIGGLWIGMTSLDVSARIRTEEAMLAGQFGEQYEAYARTTGRLLPRLRDAA